MITKKNFIRKGSRRQGLYQVQEEGVERRGSGRVSVFVWIDKMFLTTDGEKKREGIKETNPLE